MRRLEDFEVERKRVQAALRAIDGETMLRRELHESACQIFSEGDLFITITAPLVTSVDSFDKSLKTAFRQIDSKLFGRRDHSLPRLAAIVPSSPRHAHLLVKAVDATCQFRLLRPFAGACGEDLEEDVTIEVTVGGRLKKFFPAADIDIRACDDDIGRIAHYILFSQDKDGPRALKSEISSATNLSSQRLQSN